MGRLALAVPGPLSALGLEAAAPNLLWGLLGLVPLAVLQLYARRRRRVVVPFAPLLAETLGPAREQAWWRRLREALSLLLRAAALSAVVFALAGVGAVSADAPDPHAILVLDEDATLAAREGAGPRAAEARALARAWLDARPREPDRLRGPVSVVVAGPVPRVLAVGERDPARLAALLADYAREPLAGRGDLGGGLALARALAGRLGGPARGVVISAREAPGAAPHAAAPGAGPGADGLAVEWLGVGRTRTNHRLLDARAEAQPDGGWRLLFEVDSEAPGRRRLALEVLLGDEVLGGAEAEVEGPGSTARLEVRLGPAPRARGVRARLSPTDDYPPDNEAWLWLPARPAVSVLLVHDGAPRPYTVAALAALDFLDAAASGQVLARDLARAAARDVTVVDGAALSPGSLGPGAWVFLAPLGGDLPFEVGREVADPLVWRTRAHHPLLRGLDLSEAYAVRAFALAGHGLEPLAFAEGAAVVAEGARDGVRYVVLGIDPEGSALPLRAAFPLLIRNALRRLGLEPRQPLPERLGPGAPLARPPGAAAGGVRWRLGEGGPEVHDPPGRPEPPGLPAGWSGILWRKVGEGPFEAVGAASDLDPTRRVTPARPAAEAPAPAVALAPAGQRWRLLWLFLAVACLAADLLWLGSARRRSRGGPAGGAGGARGAPRAA